MRFLWHLSSIATKAIAMINYLFGTKGRIDRTGWWVRMFFILPLLFVTLFTVILVLARIATDPGNDRLTTLSPLLMIMCVLFFVRAYIATSVRRHHDMGRSGWNMLWVLVPGIGAIIDILVSGFMPGQAGPNKYGPSPKQAFSPEKSVPSYEKTQTKTLKPDGNWTMPTTSVKTPAHMQAPAKVKRQVHDRYDRSNKVQTPLVTRHVGFFGRLLGKK